MNPPPGNLAFERTGIAWLFNPSILNGLLLLFAGASLHGAQEPSVPIEINLALVAQASTSFVSGHETLGAINDGFTPANSNDKTHGAYGNWPRTGKQWVQYEWSQPITTERIDVYWFDDHRGVRLPKACQIQYWNGTAFVTLTNASGPGLLAGQFNSATFPATSTSKLRLEIDSAGSASTGILEWRVYDAGNSPNFAPIITAGPDRIAMIAGETYLTGHAQDDGKPNHSLRIHWSKESGPGNVTFSDANSLSTSARFSELGSYTLRCTADDGQLSAGANLSVSVEALPPTGHLARVETTRYDLTSSFWLPRAKNLIVHWIPHCVAKIEDPKLKEGGLENFTQAANKLAGRPYEPHVGAPFANAWVYNTLESMCLAQMLDPKGDQEIIHAQESFRKTIDDWIPKILSAQEPDGYLHTLYTISGHKRWSNKFDHEGYNAGYFIEAAMAHYLMTDGRDTQLYDAAKRLADCWSRHLGPAPKQFWYEGHQEIEQALARFADFVDQHEGKGRGGPYLDLAKFLLDCRGQGEEYDQSHLPVTHQYEAVGHAVRALYGYSGMTEIAMATGDLDYYSAVRSLWASVVHRKYYVTGGIGSGDTSEGFGKDYSLSNRAYCESCADCAELFFQHRLLRAFHQSRYVDLYEETLYNAILGSVDLDGRNFTYTNPLDSQEKRYLWHACPCCVGNIPRTILMLPTWMYSTTADSLFINLFVGSSVSVGKVAETPLRVEQKTDYPWNGRDLITLTPDKPARFSLRIRIPNRDVSELYTNMPASTREVSFLVNDSAVTPVFTDGYAVINREWKTGDKIEVAFPEQIQRVKPDHRIVANHGRVALRYGPLIYNIESVDQDVDSILNPKAPLRTEWKSDLLGGVMVIKGSFSDGKELTAIPNYARLNRGGRSIVWIKDE